MNALQLALDSGRKLDQIKLRSGEFYLNVLDVIDHDEVWEIKYRFHRELVFAYVSKDAVEAVATK